MNLRFVKFLLNSVGRLDANLTAYFGSALLERFRSLGPVCQARVVRVLQVRFLRWALLMLVPVVALGAVKAATLPVAVMLFGFFAGCLMLREARMLEETLLAYQVVSSVGEETLVSALQGPYAWSVGEWLGEVEGEAFWALAENFHGTFSELREVVALVERPLG